MLPDVAIYGGFVGNEMFLSQRPAITPDKPFINHPVGGSRQ